jgi:hypothetical protein
VKLTPLDYFTLFEAEPFDAARCAEIDAEYGLDRIDWQNDRVQVFGGMWPGVPVAQPSTVGFCSASRARSVVAML